MCTVTVQLEVEDRIYEISLNNNTVRPMLYKLRLKPIPKWMASWLEPEGYRLVGLVHTTDIP